MTTQVQSLFTDEEISLNEIGAGEGYSALILSSSMLTDRMLLYTGLLTELSGKLAVKIWAGSARNPESNGVWNQAAAKVEPLPDSIHYREFPHNLLRRFNDFVWDFQQRPPSRLSIMRHVREKRLPVHLKALRIPARAAALCKAGQLVEDRLERLLVTCQRSPVALEKMRAERPSLLITTGPQRFEEPAVAAIARSLRIPRLAFITSWDNLSTKQRLVFKYDGYLLWSERMRRELHDFYPSTRGVPTYVVGAPQFDVFFQSRFFQTREAFCDSQRLRSDLPIIVYALGSPNFVKEGAAVRGLAERIAAGEIGDVQFLVRPHPLHDNGLEAGWLERFKPRVRVQQTGQKGTAVSSRFQDEQQVMEWVNTFRHADVVVTLSSTAAVDASIFDRPVVNLDFDPEPGQPNQALIKDVNHLWTHFKPIAKSGGVWMVNDLNETMRAIKAYLANPSLHRKERHWIAQYVCEFLDGNCGLRMARAILDFAHYSLRTDRKQPS